MVVNEDNSSALGHSLNKATLVRLLPPSWRNAQTRICCSQTLTRTFRMFSTLCNATNLTGTTDVCQWGRGRVIASRIAILLDVFIP